ncbi:MAG: lysophospholipase [Cytophagales bacterium]|nr:lysophospholipase [Cytophagales bacterium]
MLKFLKSILLAYLLLLGGLYLVQDWVIFRASPLPNNYEFSFDQPFQEEFKKTPDGTQINTLFFPAQGVSKGLVFNNHGNRRNLSRWGRTAKEFTKHGYDVFFYDYRGFGKTEGKPSEENIHKDAAFLYEHMKNQYSEDSIIIYGRSLGTGVASKLASENDPKMLILETPYFNMADVGYMHLPVFPYNWLIKHSFRTDEWIGQVNAPIYIFHGTEDQLVPYESSEKLVKLLKSSNSELITLEGGGHRGLNRFEEYQQKMKELLGD